MHVIKVGGALDDQLVNLCSDVQALTQRGVLVVIVHGGSAEANRLGRQLGCPPRYLTSPSGIHSRYTDPASLDVLTMALAGRVKPRIVERLTRLGVRAVGLTGIDGALALAEKTPPARAILDQRPCIVRDDLTGRILAINTDLLRLLLDAGYVPVVSPPVIDPNVGLLNIDADRLAAAIAVALRADELVILSNVPGLLRDPEDASSLVPRLTLQDFAHYLHLAQGRMRVKLQAAHAALSAGVARVVLGDGRLLAPVLQALAGQGTTFEPSASIEEMPHEHWSRSRATARYGRDTVAFGIGASSDDLPGS